MGRAFSIACGSCTRKRAPSLCSRWHKSRAGDIRTSSVFCLKASPSTPRVLPLMTHSVSSIFLTKRFICSALIFCTSLSSPNSYPSDSDSRMNALKSLGKQLPPNPSDASRNCRPMRASIPMPWATSCTLAPDISHRTDTALM